MSNNPPTTTQPATSDDDRFVRISVKELREYIARSRELNQLRLRLNMADYTTESNVLVSQSIQSVQAVDPAQAIHPRPQAGGVQPATSLLEQALSINAMPPPTAKFTNSEGITRDLEIPRSKVPYKDIISNVIEFIKLQSQDDRRRLFLPGLMTPAAVDVIMNAVELGVSRQRACALVGISKQSYDYWRIRQKEGSEPYVSFFNLFDLAEARTEVQLVAAWRTHANTNWQAAEAFMKRRLADQWGDKQEITFSPYEIARMSTDEIEEHIGKDAIDIIDGEVMEDAPTPSIDDDDNDDDADSDPADNDDNDDYLDDDDDED